MSSANSDSPALSPLTKKQRGRLKKLRKRAQKVQHGSETSGITSFSDWSEWQELNAAQQSEEDTLAVGPSVHLRRTDQTKRQTAEVVDNRDVLWNMSQFLSASMTTSKKRKRNDKQSVPPLRIPPWCTLHNPCSTQSIAVVELCLNDACDSWQDVEQQLPVLSSFADKVALAVETRWFQGNQPKSPTDILMYASRSCPNDSKEDATLSSSSETVETVASQLEELVLADNERKKEGFPIAVESEQNRAIPGKYRSTSESPLPSLQEAKELVQLCRVAVRDCGEDEVFVSTTEGQHSSPPRVFAVDCEMVKTAKGAELARVTLLQLTYVGTSTQEGVSYKVVMDEFVKPYDTVLDYVTEYSGVTAKLLEGVSTRLEQIQAAMMLLLDANDILIGHSLENDLQSLCLVHDKVVDTAILFRSKKRKRKHCKFHGNTLFCLLLTCLSFSSFHYVDSALRHLSATLLGKKIQSNHGEDGHCSEEDAAAALNLAIRRAREGESFRLKERGDDQFHLLEQLHSSGGPIVCVGPSDWLQQHVTSFQTSAHALTCESIVDPNRKAVIAWLTSPKRRAKLVWARLVDDAKGANEGMLAKSNEILVSITN